MINKPLTTKIISLWLNGYSLDRIANRLDCTINYVNKTIDREIYHEVI
jgi:DNA-binding CsgD family transcriptional regulator